MEATEIIDSELTFSAEIGELTKALSEAHKKFKAVKKETVNPFFNKKYAELSNIIEATDEALSANGLVIIQSPGLAGPSLIRVTTLLAHTSGQWMKDTLKLPVVKFDPQGAGSAITYARRYSYQAFVSVAAEPDDDGNAASGGKQIQVSNGQATVTANKAVSGTPQQSTIAKKTTTKPAVQKVDKQTDFLHGTNVKVIEPIEVMVPVEEAQKAAKKFEASEDDIPDNIGSPKPSKDEMDAFGKRFKDLKMDMNKIGDFLRKRFDVKQPSKELNTKQWKLALAELETANQEGKLKELLG